MTRPRVVPRMSLRHGGETPIFSERASFNKRRKEPLTGAGGAGAKDPST
jgi:hypothetical protein